MSQRSDELAKDEQLAVVNRASDLGRREDVEVAECRPVFTGYFTVNRYAVRHRRFGGGWTDTFTREVFERGHAVAVLLYDPIADELVLIEQFRIGGLVAADDPGAPGPFPIWMVEIVAGIIDEGETPEEVARRESFEEAGCVVAELEFISRFLLTPGVSSESITLFVARIDASATAGIHGLAHENEDIRVFRVAADDAFRMADEGQIVNATALVALLWFRAHRGSLRDRWLTDEGEPKR